MLIWASIAASDRWLLALSGAVAVVLVARVVASRWSRGWAEFALVLTPSVALLVAGPVRPAVVLAAIGASVVGLAGLLGALIGRTWLPAVTAGLATITAAVLGAPLGGTGVFALGVVGAIGLVVAVTCSGARLPPGLVAIAALGLFALAAFGGQDGLATVAIAIVGLGFGAALLPDTDHTRRPISQAAALQHGLRGRRTGARGDAGARRRTRADDTGDAARGLPPGCGLDRHGTLRASSPRHPAPE